jgi:Fe-Mn family superoxide dismutase
LSTIGQGSAAALLAGIGVSTSAYAAPAAQTNAGAQHSLPPLPYGYNALEPHIDEQTMRIHHTRHHAAYVSNLNAALKDYPDLQQRELVDLLYRITDVPEAIRPSVINNGGGHLNHSIFWATMGPTGGGQPVGALAQAIATTFGDFAAFKARLNDAASRRFGSGWAWLVLDGTGALQVISRPNQDAPIMDGLHALLGVDVWEHAYYLKYQNRRADYLAAWWNVVNWDAVAQRYEQAGKAV